MPFDPALVVGWAIVGWVIGAIAAPLVQAMLVVDEPGLAPPARLAMLGPLGTDPVLQGMLAVAFGVLAATRSFGLPLVVQSGYAVALILVLLIDARTRYVYNIIAYPAVVAGVILTPLVLGQPLWSGLAGAVVGGVAILVLRVLGGLLFRGQEAIASGDVTIAALVGATVGFRAVPEALVSGLILGGVFALAMALVLVGNSVGVKAVARAMALGGGIGGIVHAVVSFALVGQTLPFQATFVGLLAGVVLGGVIAAVVIRFQATAEDSSESTRIALLIGLLLGALIDLGLSLGFVGTELTPQLALTAALVGTAASAGIGAVVALALRLRGATMAYGPGLCLGALLVIIGSS